MKHEPARKNFVVVAYDISDDKRRTALHKKLKAFGLAVQYSVFECLLNRDQIQQMKKTIQESIKTKAGDRVRYYFCAKAAAAVFKPPTASPGRTRRRFSREAAFQKN